MSDLFIHADSSPFHCSSPDFIFPSDADFQYLSNHNLHFQNPLPAIDSNPNFPIQQQLPLHLPPFIPNGFQNPPNFDLKNEESHLGFFPDQPLCFDAINTNKSSLHRSFSEKPSLLYQSPLESPLVDPHNFPSSEAELFSSQIRRVFSTGDLQSPVIGPFSSPVSENGSLEEGNFKVGKYSAEERKEKISKYRAKRTQRNFNKTIKYACRKTLADNRPRIRGRFARNDEPGDNPKAACSNRDEEDDEFWMEGLQEETMKGKQYNEMYGRMQFQYCGV